LANITAQFALQNSIFPLALNYLGRQTNKLILIMTTRFQRISQQTNIEFQKKCQFFTKKFTISLFYLFLGFLIGNLFGTLIDFFRLLLWDGFIILGVIFVFEGISFLNYRFLIRLEESKRDTTFSSKSPSAARQSSLFVVFIKSLNFLKLGILLGFFIDAFKVGS
jgi:hypothetical protein